MGSRIRGKRETGQHDAAAIGRRLYGRMFAVAFLHVRFTDMSPFRAMPARNATGLGMTEMTYGWNLEMQMRAAAAGLRIVEIPVDHRCRRGGESKVSGQLVAGLSAAWKISVTFVRLILLLRTPHGRSGQIEKTSS